MLLKSSADATLCSPTGETALSFAACQGQLDAVEQLLEYGADPDVANAVGLIYNINNSFSSPFITFLGKLSAREKNCCLQEAVESLCF